MLEAGKFNKFAKIKLPFVFYLYSGAHECSVGSFSHSVGAYEGPISLPPSCQRTSVNIGDVIEDTQNSYYIEIISVYCDEEKIHPWCRECVLRPKITTQESVVVPASTNSFSLVSSHSAK